MYSFYLLLLSLCIVVSWGRNVDVDQLVNATTITFLPGSYQIARHEASDYLCFRYSYMNQELAWKSFKKEFSFQAAWFVFFQVLEKMFNAESLPYPYKKNAGINMFFTLLVYLRSFFPKGREPGRCGWEKAWTVKWARVKSCNAFTLNTPFRTLMRPHMLNENNVRQNRQQYFSEKMHFVAKECGEESVCLWNPSTDAYVLAVDEHGIILSKTKATQWKFTLN